MRFLKTSLCAALAAACGPIDQSGGAGAGSATPDAGAGGASPPAVDIHVVSPTDGATCKADDHGNCPISVAVSGATLAAPGRCGAAQPCGHIDLYIDGTACGSPNVQSSSDDITASFGRCKKIEGTHTLLCELRDDRNALLARSPEVRLEVKKEDHHGDDDDDD